MSFTPGRGELGREALRSHEIEAELVTRNYEHTHPQAQFGLPKRPGLIRRLLQKLRGREAAE